MLNLDKASKSLYNTNIGTCGKPPGPPALVGERAGRRARSLEGNGLFIMTPFPSKRQRQEGKTEMFSHKPCTVTGMPSLLLGLVVLTLMNLLILPAYATTRPQIPQNESRTFPATGTDPTSFGLTWDIVPPSGGGPQGDSNIPHGWTVSYNAGTNQFTVGAPFYASIAMNYEVRFNTGSGFRSAFFDVIPAQIGSPQISSLTLNPTVVTGGNTSTGTVTLDGPAPTGGATVLLASSSSVATVPTSVNVAEGSTSATFTIATNGPGDGGVFVTIYAFCGGINQTAQLQVNAPPHGPQLSNLSLDAASIVGGDTATGTVTMSQAIPWERGVYVYLSSSNTSVATVPASVTVSYGQTTATFPVNTSTVSASTQVTISASYNGVRTINLTVNPAASTSYVSNLTLNPSSVTGGSSATGTVRLSAAAPTGGAVVHLSSSTAAVGVPASVTVAAGTFSVTFPISSGAVTEVTSATISGSYNSWTQADILTVLPTELPLTVQNLSATGGNGCVFLDWMDLPSGSVRGYNVYRIVDGAPVRLTTSPVTSAMYADTGLTNGVTYSYQVTVVNLQNQEINTSSQVGAAPSDTAPTAAWLNPPATATGTLCLYVSIATQETATSGDVSGYGGVMYSATWNGIKFWPESNDATTNHPDNNIDVAGTVNGREYSFVWLDCCHSAGGGPKTQSDPYANAIGVRDPKWANAFGIQDIGYEAFGAFWGWNGNGAQNEVMFSGDPSHWYNWRMSFWFALSQGYPLINAGTYATQHTQYSGSGIHPWDQDPVTGNYRAVIVGDPLHTLP
jgi:hypothetical protein